MTKVINGYCPLCGEFITTKFGDENIIITKHKKFVTLYHWSCYKFNFLGDIDESEVIENGHKQSKKEQ